jgi:hypothetical protein
MCATQLSSSCECRSMDGSSRVCFRCCSCPFSCFMCAYNPALVFLRPRPTARPPAGSKPFLYYSTCRIGIWYCTYSKDRRRTVCQPIDGWMDHRVSAFVAFRALSRAPSLSWFLLHVCGLYLPSNKVGLWLNYCILHQIRWFGRSSYYKGGRSFVTSPLCVGEMSEA